MNKIDIIAKYISDRPLYLFILIVIIVRMLDILSAYMWFSIRPETFLEYESNEFAKKIFYNHDWKLLMESIIIPFFVIIILIAVAGHYLKFNIIKFLLLAYATFEIAAILSNVMCIFSLPKWTLYLLAPIDAFGLVIITIGVYASVKSWIGY